MIGHRQLGGSQVSVAGLALLIATGIPGDATAQGPWYLKGLRAGTCVEFLVSPTAAAEVMGTWARPVDVATRAERHPILARTAAAETAYTGWAPAEYCLFLYQEAVVGGSTFRVDQGRKPLVVGFLAIGAEGLPDGATDYLTEFFTNQGGLRGAMAQAGVTVDRVVFELTPVPGQESDPDRARFSARHGRTTVQWDGGPGAPREHVTQRSLRLSGRIGGTHLQEVDIAMTPDSVFTPSGSLRVIGRGSIGELLSASPIRQVTEFARGGDDDWIIR
jgi:hypothetical protein